MSSVIHQMALPKAPQRWAFATDWHEDTLNIPTFNIFIQYMLSLPKDQRNVILGGDFLNLNFLMPKGAEFQSWVKNPLGCDTYFLPLWEKETRWGNEKLDELQSVCNNIIFLHGNHDNPRADVFREKYCPVGYREHFHVGKALNLEKRGIGEVMYGDWLDVGPYLSFCHGMAHGPSAPKRHFMLSGGRTVVHGHLHHYECTAFPVRGDTRYVYSMPCMADLNPAFIKNIDNNWANGFGDILLMPDGSHYIDVYIVKNGQTSIHGKVYIG